MVSGGTAGVVVVRIPEAGGLRGVGIVKLAQAHERSSTVDIGYEVVLHALADGLATAPDEPEFIQAAEAAVDGVGAGAQVHGRVHSNSHIGLSGRLRQPSTQVQQ